MQPAESRNAPRNSPDSAALHPGYKSVSQNVQT
jgi:hypothetical protein